MLDWCQILHQLSLDHFKDYGWFFDRVPLYLLLLLTGKYEPFTAGSSDALREIE